MADLPVVDMIPCPYCPSESAAVAVVQEGIGYAGRCEVCYTRGPVDPTIEGAVIGWNTRPIEDALRAEIERLQARLAELEPGEKEVKWHKFEYGLWAHRKRIYVWRPSEGISRAEIEIQMRGMTPAEARRMAKALVAAAREAEAMNREVGK